MTVSQTMAKQSGEVGPVQKLQGEYISPTHWIQRARAETGAFERSEPRMAAVRSPRPEGSAACDLPGFQTGGGRSARTALFLAWVVDTAPDHETEDVFGPAFVS